MQNYSTITMLPERLAVERASKTTSIFFVVFYLFFLLLFSYAFVISLTSKTWTPVSFIVCGLGLFVSLPMAVFFIYYSSLPKTFLKIEDNGLQLANYPFVPWNEIDALKLRQFSGPRMKVYRINVYTNKRGSHSMRLFFCNDINVHYDNILDLLAQNCTRNGIKML